MKKIEIYESFIKLETCMRDLNVEFFNKQKLIEENRKIN